MSSRDFSIFNKGVNTRSDAQIRIDIKQQIIKMLAHFYYLSVERSIVWEAISNTRASCFIIDSKHLETFSFSVFDS